jgi:hypothetical protein
VQPLKGRLVYMGAIFLFGTKLWLFISKKCVFVCRSLFVFLYFFLLAIVWSIILRFTDSDYSLVPSNTSPNGQKSKAISKEEFDECEINCKNTMGHLFMRNVENFKTFILFCSPIFWLWGYRKKIILETCHVHCIRYLHLSLNCYCRQTHYGIRGRFGFMFSRCSTGYLEIPDFLNNFQKISENRNWLLKHKNAVVSNSFEAGGTDDFTSNSEYSSYPNTTYFFNL